MGVVGASWATVVSRGLVLIPAFVWLYRGFAGLRIRRLAFRWRTMRQILKIGVPSCGTWLVRMVQYLYLAHFLAKVVPEAQVTAAQAAYNIGLRLDALALFCGVGWGAAAATIVGQNLGAARPDRAVRATWIAVGINCAMMLLFACGYVLFAEPLIRFLGSESRSADFDSVVRLGRTFLLVSSAGYAWVAIGIVLSHALAGAGRTKAAFAIEVVGYTLIGAPLAWLVAQNVDFFGGVRGLYLAMLGTHLLVACAYVVWFRLGHWTRHARIG
jgi:Na+-driven multidrug efflux pump